VRSLQSQETKDGVCVSAQSIFEGEKPSWNKKEPAEGSVSNKIYIFPLLKESKQQHAQQRTEAEKRATKVSIA